MLSCSVVSNFLQPHELANPCQAPLSMGSSRIAISFFRGIFLIQGLLHLSGLFTPQPPGKCRKIIKSTAVEIMEGFECTYLQNSWESRCLRNISLPSLEDGQEARQRGEFYWETASTALLRFIECEFAFHILNRLSFINKDPFCSLSSYFVFFCK